MTYTDLYLLPVPAANLDAYEQVASKFGAIAREHGALSYRELLADDPQENLDTDEGVVMVAAVVEFDSRASRDRVMELTIKDPRLQGLMDHENPLADMSAMVYGGFKPFVTV
jgi:uncharacterized protein YbaA (DUF1428 family)